MKEKEEAERIMNRYTSVIKGTFAVGEISENAKQCALIHVDEIIKALKITTGHCTLRLGDRQEVHMDFEWWDRVKSIIENK